MYSIGTYYIQFLYFFLLKTVIKLMRRSVKKKKILFHHFMYILHTASHNKNIVGKS